MVYYRATVREDVDTGSTKLGELPNGSCVDYLQVAWWCDVRRFRIAPTEAFREGGWISEKSLGWSTARSGGYSICKRIGDPQPQPQPQPPPPPQAQPQPQLPPQPPPSSAQPSPLESQVPQPPPPHPPPLGRPGPPPGGLGSACAGAEQVPPLGSLMAQTQAQAPGTPPSPGLLVTDLQLQLENQLTLNRASLQVGGSVGRSRIHSIPFR